MHIKESAEKSVETTIAGLPARETVHASKEIVLDDGDMLENLTPEQKDAILEAAFLPNGDNPLPPAAPPTVYSPEEYDEIRKDLRRLEPTGTASGTMSESTLHVASKKLAGPPIEAPHESRVTKTSLDGGSDNIPPARR